MQGNPIRQAQDDGFLLQHPLRARNALHARIAADGLLERAGEALEDRLDEVMRLVGIEDLDVQRQARLLREGAEEFDRELRRKIARLEPVQIECPSARARRAADAR